MYALREGDSKQKTIFRVFYKKSPPSSRECCEWDMLLLNGNAKNRGKYQRTKNSKQNGIENGIVLHFIKNC